MSLAHSRSELDVQGIIDVWTIEGWTLVRDVHDFSKRVLTFRRKANSTWSEADDRMRMRGGHSWR